MLMCNETHTTIESNRLHALRICGSKLLLSHLWEEGMKNFSSLMENFLQNSIARVRSKSQTRFGCACLIPTHLKNNIF